MRWEVADKSCYSLHIFFVGSIIDIRIGVCVCGRILERVGAIRLSFYVLNVMKREDKDSNIANYVAYW